MAGSRVLTAAAGDNQAGQESPLRGEAASGLAVIRRAAILRLPRAGGLLLLAAQNLSHLLYSL